MSEWLMGARERYRIQEEVINGYDNGTCSDRSLDYSAGYKRRDQRDKKMDQKGTKMEKTKRRKMRFCLAEQAVLWPGSFVFALLALYALGVLIYMHFV